MVAKKSLVNDKISPCVTQICLLGVACKVSNSKTLSGETFCILEKRLLSIFEFCEYLIVFFTTCWLAHNQLSWTILLFSCNPIGQLCLSSPGYSSRTVKVLWFSTSSTESLFIFLLITCHSKILHCATFFHNSCPEYCLNEVWCVFLSSLEKVSKMWKSSPFF